MFSYSKMQYSSLLSKNTVHCLTKNYRQNALVNIPCMLRSCEISNNGILFYSRTSENQTEDLNDIVNRWYKKYQDFVGISEILEAQEKVTVMTNSLLSVQNTRRQLHRDVENVHQQLLDTHQKITKSELYSEDHYTLFEKARQLNSSLKNFQNDFRLKEEEERTLFTQLSTAIQYCHEKERTHSEHSKYWSIIISVTSASIAAFVTSVNNWVRIKQIKDHSTELHKDVQGSFQELYSILSHPSVTSNEKASSVSYEELINSIESTMSKSVVDGLKNFYSSSLSELVPLSSSSMSENMGSSSISESSSDSYYSYDLQKFVFIGSLTLASVLVLSFFAR